MYTKYSNVNVYKFNLVPRGFAAFWYKEVDKSPKGMTTTFSGSNTCTERKESLEVFKKIKHNFQVIKILFFVYSFHWRNLVFTAKKTFKKQFYIPT